MKRILITGGTGFFGKSILDYFVRHDNEYEFIILSRRGFSLGFLDKAKQLTNRPVGQILGDVRTFDVGSAHFDYVIHAATPARVDVSDDEMRSIIIDGTANAIRQAKRCGTTKFMMVSSGGVYGKNLLGAVNERDFPQPVTTYGTAKLEAEQMAIDSGLHVLLPRCFAFVGKHLERNAHFAIGNFIRDALAGHDIIINGDGTPMRSYLYADDLVEWLFAILDRGESGRVYNVGSPEAISIRDLAVSVRDALGAKSEVKVLGEPVPGAANFYVPDVSRIQSELGVEVKHPLAEAIRESV